MRQVLRRDIKRGALSRDRHATLPLARWGVASKTSRRVPGVRARRERLGTRHVDGWPFDGTQAPGHRRAGGKFQHVSQAAPTSVEVPQHRLSQGGGPGYRCEQSTSCFSLRRQAGLEDLVLDSGSSVAHRSGGSGLATVAVVLGACITLNTGALPAHAGLFEFAAQSSPRTVTVNRGWLEGLLMQEATARIHQMSDSELVAAFDEMMRDGRGNAPSLASPPAPNLARQQGSKEPSGNGAQGTNLYKPWSLGWLWDRNRSSAPGVGGMPALPEEVGEGGKKTADGSLSLPPMNPSPLSSSPALEPSPSEANPSVMRTSPPTSAFGPRQTRPLAPAEEPASALWKGSNPREATPGGRTTPDGWEPFRPSNIQDALKLQSSGGTSNWPEAPNSGTGSVDEQEALQSGSGSKSVVRAAASMGRGGEAAEKVSPDGGFSVGSAPLLRKEEGTQGASVEGGIGGESSERGDSPEGGGDEASAAPATPLVQGNDAAMTAPATDADDPGVGEGQERWASAVAGLEAVLQKLTSGDVTSVMDSNPSPAGGSSSAVERLRTSLHGTWRNVGQGVEAFPVAVKAVAAVAGVLGILTLVIKRTWSRVSKGSPQRPVQNPAQLPKPPDPGGATAPLDGGRNPERRPGPAALSRALLSRFARVWASSPFQKAPPSASSSTWHRAEEQGGSETASVAPRSGGVEPALGVDPPEDEQARPRMIRIRRQGPGDASDMAGPPALPPPGPWADGEGTTRSAPADALAGADDADVGGSSVLWVRRGAPAGGGARRLSRAAEPTMDRRPAGHADAGEREPGVREVSPGGGGVLWSRDAAKPDPVVGPSTSSGVGRQEGSMERDVAPVHGGSGVATASPWARNGRPLSSHLRESSPGAEGHLERGNVASRHVNGSAVLPVPHTGLADRRSGNAVDGEEVQHGGGSWSHAEEGAKGTSANGVAGFVRDNGQGLMGSRLRVDYRLVWDNGEGLEP